MRYLLLSDIHSNLEALEACLALAKRKYDKVLCLGDLVGYGPDPNAVMKKIVPLAAVILRGNHDKASAGLMDTSDFNPHARAATEWTRQALTPQHLAFLRSLPAGPVRLDGFEMVHGSPRDEDEYILGPGQAFSLLKSASTPVVCFGHTHYQGGFMMSPQGQFENIRPPLGKDGLTLTLSLETEGRYLLNPGSVGQPRDGEWRAAFAILDTARHTFDYFRVSYDLPKTQEKMKRAGLPDVLIQRLQYGR